MERTLVLLKPDSVQRGLVGEVVSRIEKRGLKLAAIKLINVTENQAKLLYAEHAAKPFYGKLTAYITSNPVVAIVLEAEAAVKVVRDLIGDTNPLDAASGTVRGDYAMSVSFNMIHGSDSIESAGREIGIFFQTNEIVSYSRVIDHWITGS